MPFPLITGNVRILDDISPTMLDEILSTLLVFVGSANREIVKSALGFIKLSVHTLPVEMVMPHLTQLVPALLSWSGDHKNHFKVKVRHIFERMIRRFGWEAVHGCVGHEDQEKGKVLLNIKKRKDRAKRKKARRADEDEDDLEEVDIFVPDFIALLTHFEPDTHSTQNWRRFRGRALWQ